MNQIHVSQLLVTQIARAFPEAIFYRETLSPTVALTIDDVGDPSTQLILDAIAKHNQEYLYMNRPVTATFFVITNYLKQPSLLHEIIKGGHEIGNHGQYDRTHANLSAAEFEVEINQAHQIITSSKSIKVKWFRPGRAFYNKKMFRILLNMTASYGYHPQFALASMIPIDTYKLTNQPQFLLKYLTNFIFSGAILVLHGGTVERAKNTALVLQYLLQDLQQKNYQVISLSELLAA